MADVRKEQFHRLVAPHLERLFRVACRLLGNTADARDLVQDTCVIACENLTELAANSHPERWLLRVQRNRFIDRARRLQRGPVVTLRVPARTDRWASTEAGPEELLQRDEEERALDLAFQKLDETHRLLLSLRAEGYGLAEIEAITGIGRDVLRARLHRARRSLAQHLDAQQHPATHSTRIGSTT
ncbi:MAG: sigma-70 family RNA polymerase sigma factor [Steroidobacteraceae bacterium]